MAGASGSDHADVVVGGLSGRGGGCDCSGAVGVAVLALGVGDFGANAARSASWAWGSSRPKAVTTTPKGASTTVIVHSSVRVMSRPNRGR